MSIRETDFLQFVTAFRGYDGLQVDDYINRLRDYASQFEERAPAAEPELADANAELVPLREELDDVDGQLADARRQLREALTTELPPPLGQILWLASEDRVDARAGPPRRAGHLAPRSCRPRRHAAARPA